MPFGIHQQLLIHYGKVLLDLFFDNLKLLRGKGYHMLQNINYDWSLTSSNFLQSCVRWGAFLLSGFSFQFLGQLSVFDVGIRERDSKTPFHLNLFSQHHSLHESTFVIFGPPRHRDGRWPSFQSLNCFFRIRKIRVQKI